MAAPVSQSSDEVRRKLLKPTSKPDQVIGVLKKSFIVPDHYQTLQIKRELDSYDDKNYWIEAGGVEYLVKVHNGVESEDLISKVQKKQHEASVIHLQNTIMRHLAQHGIDTSEPLKPVEEDEKTALPTEGSVHPLPVHSRQHSPCKLVVRMLKWVPGTTMASLDNLPVTTLSEAGRYLANMHQKLDLLNIDKLAAAKRYHQWDGKNTYDLQDFVNCIDDVENRLLVLSVLDAFKTEVVDSGDAEHFQQGLIHGDFNDANIIVDKDNKVSGVIDFGDSVYSWRVLDLAVGMAYAMLSAYGKRNRMLSAATAFLRGYQSVNTLSEIEMKHLGLLVACRLTCSVTLGAYSHKQNPGNSYLLLHAQPAWNGLKLIWDVDLRSRRLIRQAVDGMFKKALVDDKTKSATDCEDIIIADSEFSARLQREIADVIGGLIVDGRPKKQRRTT